MPGHAARTRAELRAGDLATIELRDPDAAPRCWTGTPARRGRDLGQLGDLLAEAETDVELRGLLVDPRGIAAVENG